MKQLLVTVCWCHALLSSRVLYELSNLDRSEVQEFHQTAFCIASWYAFAFTISIRGALAVLRVVGVGLEPPLQVDVFEEQVGFDIGDQ